MTYETTMQKIHGLQQRAAELDSYERLSGPQRAERDGIAADIDHLRDKAQMERKADLERIRGAARGEGGLKVERGAPTAADYPHDQVDTLPTGYAPHSFRDGAFRVLDANVRSRHMNQDAATVVDGLLRTGSRAGQDWTARWLAVTGTPEYRSGFAKLLSGDQGHMYWDDRERAAMIRANEFQQGERAMAIGTDPAGGYLVPAHLDPAILVTNTGTDLGMRALARVETIPGSEWNGVSSAGVTAHWYAEAAQVSDDSPTLAQPNVPVHRASAFVPFSMEFGMDSAGGVDQLGMLLVDAARNLQAQAYVNGTGTGQPKGIITALTGTASAVTGSVGALVADDVYKLQNGLGARWQGQAQWAAHLGIYNEVRALTSPNGNYTFPELANGRLLNRTAAEVSDMDATIATGSQVLLYGDFKAGFLVADRLGTTVELISHLFGANQRPTGQRGLYMNFRTGSDVLVANALRMLVVG